MVVAGVPAACSGYGRLKARRARFHKEGSEMLIVAFACFLALVVAWLVASTPTATAAPTPSLAAQGAGD